MAAKPKVFYTATATASGDGRKGHVRSSDGLIDMELATPKPLTTATKTNPEQLFAAGYAACFNSAYQSAAKKMRAPLGSSDVTAKVGIGPISLKAFGLAVTLEIETTGVDKATAEEIAEAAHEMCPYSNATRGNIEVDIVVKAL